MLLGVDIGGTFTDFVLVADTGSEAGRITLHKRLTSAADPARAVGEGVRELGLPADASALPLLLEFAATGRFPSRGLIPLAMGASIAWVISVAVGGVILTYVSSLWTLAYQQFTRPAGAPGSPPTPPVFQ